MGKKWCTQLWQDQAQILAVHPPVAGRGKSYPSPGNSYPLPKSPGSHSTAATFAAPRNNRRQAWSCPAAACWPPRPATLRGASDDSLLVSGRLVSRLKAQQAGGMERCVRVEVVGIWRRHYLACNLDSIAAPTRPCRFCKWGTPFYTFGHQHSLLPLPLVVGSNDTGPWPISTYLHTPSTMHSSG